MTRLFSIFSIVLFALYQIGCNSQDTQNRLENPIVKDTVSGISAAPIGDDVELTNMYEEEIELLPNKSRVQIVTVLEGTGRSAIEARYIGERDFGFGFPVYECELVDQSVEAMGGIAQGMSGSPVGPPGRVMGALAYGNAFSGTPTRFWVTSIDAMEATKTHLTLGERLENGNAPGAPSAITSTFTPVKTPMMITGIQPHRLSQIEDHLKEHNLEYLQMFASMGGNEGAPANVKPNLAAGDMIGVGVATGDVVNAIGFGTVTQVYDDGTFLAFGHPMTQAGKTSMPVYRAVVNGLVPSLQISYKSSYAYGDPIGTIKKDLLPAIVGELGDAPDMIPVTVSYQLDSEGTITKNHEVAYGLEPYIPVVAALTFDSLRQEVNFGTVEGTITLEFDETDKTFTKKYYAASPNPFLDVLVYVTQAVASFKDITLNTAGKATINNVSITIKDSPKIRVATVHEIVAPDTITPGEQATFTVKLLPHWTGVTNGRKIEKEITLDIPEGWTDERYEFSVTSPYPDGPPNAFASLLGIDIVDEIISALDGEEVVETLPPENLDELIERNSEGMVDNPGLLTIVLKPVEDFSFDDGFFDDFDFGFEDVGNGPPNGGMQEDVEPPPPSVESTFTIDDFFIVGVKSVIVDIAVD